MGQGLSKYKFPYNYHLAEPWKCRVDRAPLLEEQSVEGEKQLYSEVISSLTKGQTKPTLFSENNLSL